MDKELDYDFFGMNINREEVRNLVISDSSYLEESVLENENEN